MTEVAPAKKGWKEHLALGLAIGCVAASLIELTVAGVQKADSYRTYDQYTAIQERHDAGVDFRRAIWFGLGGLVIGGIWFGLRQGRLAANHQPHANQ